MQISLLSPFIRVDVFKEYKLREYETISNARAKLDERDQKLRQLNKEWGFIETDGTYGIGCKSSVQVDYHTKYQEISNQGTQNFEAANQKFHQWRDEQFLTIQEYLFLIDFFIYLETVDEAFSKAQIDDGLIFNSLDLHASHLIKRTRHSVQTLKRTEFEGTFLEKLQISIDAHESGKIHVHKFLKIGLLNVGEKKFINKYYADLATRVKVIVNSFINENYQNLNN